MQQLSKIKRLRLQFHGCAPRLVLEFATTAGDELCTIKHKALSRRSPCVLSHRPPHLVRQSKVNLIYRNTTSSSSLVGVKYESHDTGRSNPSLWPGEGSNRRIDAPIVACLSAG